MVVYILFYRFLPHHRLVCALLMSCLRNPQRPLSCSVWLVGKHHAGAVFTELFERLTNLFICHYHRVGLREQVLRSLAFSLCMLCPPVADADITFLPCDFYLSIFFIPRLISAVGCLPYCDTWCGLSATLECMSETCCTRLAGNTARKKSPSAHRRTTLSGYIFVTKARIDNRKKVLNSSISPTCPYNMVNFGPLTAEIFWRVWGTPAYFNGFRDFAALLYATLVVGVSQTAALNRGRHLHSTGWPSCWALVHILVYCLLLRVCEPWIGSVFCHVVSSSSSIFFPRLISAVGDWMSVSAILLHMVWP